ncbi:hypothetical protein BH18VER1_BH18VER1_20230 [soil metagenome]
MALRDSDLDRLFRSAQTQDETPAPVPFGFDTRVVALWRASAAEGNAYGRELMRFLRNVAVSAALVTTVATVAAYWQLNENEETGEPLTNAYAFADNAIESGVFE